MKIRVRYAPSPTGDFHIGGARTALFNYLFAKKYDGQFILRIEDTDRSRFNVESTSKLIEGLDYLGLSWDEGPSVKDLIDLGVQPEDALYFGKERQPFGPYVQTKRLPIYKTMVEELLKIDAAYMVFGWQNLGDDKNAIRRNEFEWRLATYGQQLAIRDTGEPYYIKLKLPRHGETIVNDELRGNITFRWTKLQDPVIIKSDGLPTYHFAAVVDDHLMEISHVFRGAEWISSFPLHNFIYDSFGWSKPKFIHLPLIMNPVGKGKMSKRETRAPDGTIIPVFLFQYQQDGYLPEAMVNFLARTGWNKANLSEFTSVERLIEEFDIDHINLNNPIFDFKRLQYYNNHYIKRLSPEKFAEIAEMFI